MSKILRKLPGIVGNVYIGTHTQIVHLIQNKCKITKDVPISAMGARLPYPYFAACTTCDSV